jgi:hypothetical protein
LNRSPEYYVSHFVEQNGKNNRGGKPEDYIEKAYGKRVTEKPEEIRIVKKGPEIPETHPLAPAYAEIGPEILKGDDKTVHGLVTENNEIRKHGQNQEILILVLLKIPFKGFGQGRLGPILHD